MGRSTTIDVEIEEWHSSGQAIISLPRGTRGDKYKCDAKLTLTLAPSSIPDWLDGMVRHMAMEADAQNVSTTSDGGLLITFVDYRLTGDFQNALDAVGAHVEELDSSVDSRRCYSVHWYA